MYSIDRNVVTDTIGSLKSFVAMTGMTGHNLKNMKYTDSLKQSTLTVRNTGVYMVICQIDGKLDSGNTDLGNALFINGVLEPTLISTRRYMVPNTDGSSIISGLLSLTSGDRVSLCFSASKATTTFTTRKVSMMLVKIGP